MLETRISEILKQKGKSMYWLSKQTGLSNNNIAKICNGETIAIRFDSLEKICLALDCSINDLFKSNDPKMRLLLSGSAK